VEKMYAADCWICMIRLAVKSISDKLKELGIKSVLNEMFLCMTKAGLIDMSNFRELNIPYYLAVKIKSTA
jgi:hypothetical protein